MMMAMMTIMRNMMDREECCGDGALFVAVDDIRP